MWKEKKRKVKTIDVGEGGPGMCAGEKSAFFWKFYSFCYFFIKRKTKIRKKKKLIEATATTKTNLTFGIWYVIYF